VAVNAKGSIIYVKGSIMGSNDQSLLCERKNTIQDESGYVMKLDEITFNQVDLKWGSYINPNEKMLSFHPAKPAIVSHFRMLDSPGSFDKRYYNIPEKQFVVYREAAESYDLYVAPTKNKARSFFELAISDHFFSNLFTEESDFMMCFRNYSSVNTPSFDFTAQMTPAMYGVINDMHNSPYSGYLKGVYLEAKAIELFLMQVNQLDQKNLVKQSKLKSGDVECLYEVKNYITSHFNQPFSIIDLAKKAGINQTKLKIGFKELFNTTVFGYLNDVRMQEAKRLLLDKKMYVNEVADRIGYKHPQHFTAAFRKKFGIVPKDLKN